MSKKCTPLSARLPRKVTIHVTKRHACHQVPRLPRETKVDVSKCHACHANSRGATTGHSGPSAPPEPAQFHTCHACNTKWQSMSPSATPATQSEDTCRQVPRLPRKVKIDVAKCQPRQQPRRQNRPLDVCEQVV